MIFIVQVRHRLVRYISSIHLHAKGGVKVVKFIDKLQNSDIIIGKFQKEFTSRNTTEKLRYNINC